ncbi:hypothetical protein PENSPDRAFT_318230 [Peniophora sp. CONT]|nr:hypothetical protein PENSPDRAFT_318230 [Peniophora sp. CONT]
MVPRVRLLWRSGAPTSSSLFLKRLENRLGILSIVQTLTNQQTLPEHAVKKWVNPILTDLELATLMSKSNKNSRTKLYSIKSLLAFILKRSSELGIDIVASIRLQEESLQGPLQLRHYDPPLRYFRTSNDPPKGDIVFDNEVLPVDTRTLSIDDASLIYAIPRKRLMALHAWHTELDITTVAIIALERRGGFHFHNNRIVKRRRKAIRRLRRVRFATEGVHLYGRNAWQVCERLLGPLPTGAIGLGENNVDPTNRRMYVKQYLPVGCVVVRDENNVLRPRHWFHGSLNYPLDEVLDLTLAIPTK